MANTKNTKANVKQTQADAKANAQQQAKDPLVQALEQLDLAKLSALADAGIEQASEVKERIEDSIKDSINDAIMLDKIKEIAGKHHVWISIRIKANPGSDDDDSGSEPEIQIDLFNTPKLALTHKSQNSGQLAKLRAFGSKWIPGLDQKTYNTTLERVARQIARAQGLSLSGDETLEQLYKMIGYTEA